MPEASSQKPLVRQQYNDIAALYDMLAEGDDGMIWFRHNLEGILKKLPGDAKVLDCSCGTGDQAIWLAQQGFEVYASDISDGMLEIAVQKAVKADVEITFFRSSWTALPEKTHETFNLIVAPGNSLSHLENISVIDDIFNSVRKVLKPTGYFFFDIRNWEKTLEEDNLELQEFNVAGQDGISNVIYSYDMPAMNETGHMHVDIRAENEEEYKRYSFDFMPVAYQQFHDAALRAGFENVKRGYFPGKEYYYMILS